LAKWKLQGPPPWITNKEGWQRRLREQRDLSPEAARQIADEAIAGGQKWDVQEKINARRLAELATECGSSGKIQAPAKFDAAVRRPRCQVGAGSFGTYFVHTSQKYGVKFFNDPDADVDFEFDALNKAVASGANVPKPLNLNTVLDQDGEPKAHTLTMTHMQGYAPATSVYGNDRNWGIDNAPTIVKVKALREFRKLHVAGVAHGDIHGGNILINDRSKRVAIIDFGYATSLDDARHPIHSRDGISNLLLDLERLPNFVGFDRSEFIDRHEGVIKNIERQAADYNSNWERYELAINRYHDALERELLWDERKPRSRFVSSADQPRIPGLTRRLLTANVPTAHRERIAVQPGALRFADVAQELGVNPPRLFLALKPERQALAARQQFNLKPQRKPQPVPVRRLTPRDIDGRTLVRKFNSAGVVHWVPRDPASTPRPAIKAKRNPALKTPTGMIRIKPGTPTGMRRLRSGAWEFVNASWSD
jgi:hypothetical protein